MTDTDLTDTPELEYLGEVRPGKSYLLRATEPLPPQAAMRLRETLERTFPGSTFAILSHNLEPVNPTPAADLLLQNVLRNTALKYQKQATKMEPGPSRAAAQIVGNALLDVWHALMTGDGAATPPAVPSTTPVATGEGAAVESATGSPPPAAPSPQYCQAVKRDAVGEALRTCHQPAGHLGSIAHLDGKGWWRE